MRHQPADPSPKRPVPAGFTLVEMMVVVAVVAILSGLAIYSMRANTEQAAMDEFSSNIVNSIKEARSRATSSGNRFAVKFTRTGVQWCERDCPPNQPNTPGIELGKLLRGRNGAQATKLARVADVALPQLPTMSTLPAEGFTLYFMPDGSIDSDLTTPQGEGFTLYLEHETESELKHRIAILPLSGDIRHYKRW